MAIYLPLRQRSFCSREMEEKKAGYSVHSKLIAVFRAIALSAAVVIAILASSKPDVQISERWTAEVVSSTYTQLIDISGYVEPYESQTLRFQSTGAVTSLFAE